MEVFLQSGYLPIAAVPARSARRGPRCAVMAGDPSVSHRLRYVGQRREWWAFARHNGGGGGGKPFIGLVASARP